MQAIRASARGTRQTRQTMADLVRQGDDDSIEVLLRLSREQGDLASAALSALGEVTGSQLRARVAGELQRRMGDGVADAVSAAVVGYIRVMGDEALAEARAFLRRNGDRPDGSGQAVCTAAAKALGELDTPAADQVLIEELGRGMEPGWLPDYGSEVVRALAKPDRKTVERNVRGFRSVHPKRALSPEARGALVNYAACLVKKMPGPDNPPGRTYYQEKIEEVRAALAGEKAEAGTPAPPPPRLP